MDGRRGLLGLILILLVAWAVSRGRRQVSGRTVGTALALQIAFAFVVLRWGPGKSALRVVSSGVESLIGCTTESTSFLFGPLLGTATRARRSSPCRCCRSSCSSARWSGRCSTCG